VPFSLAHLLTGNTARVSRTGRRTSASSRSCASTSLTPSSRGNPTFPCTHLSQSPRRVARWLDSCSPSARQTRQTTSQANHQQLSLRGGEPQVPL
jgi:hypothetical protein